MGRLERATLAQGQSANRKRKRIGSICLSYPTKQIARGLSTARVALTISRWNVQESSLARLKMRSTRHSIGTTSGSYAEPVTGHSFCCRQRAPDNEICPLRQAVLRARKELSTGFETAIDMDSSAIGQARPCRLAVTVFVLAWQPKSRRNSGRASPLRPH